MYLAGDLTARTKDFLEYIPQDTLNNIYNTEVEYNSDKFDMSGANKYTLRYNRFGKTLTEMCCLHNIHILNRRMHGDKEGHFICLNANGGHVM